jgi:hypothetical protein
MASGRGSWCRKCQAASTRRWRAENRDAINGRRREAYRADPEPERARVLARYHAHRPPLTPFRVARCRVCGTEFRTRQPISLLTVIEAGGPIGDGAEFRERLEEACPDGDCLGHRVTRLSDEESEMLRLAIEARRERPRSHAPLH